MLGYGDNMDKNRFNNVISFTEINENDFVVTLRCSTCGCVATTTTHNMFEFDQQQKPRKVFCVSCGDEYTITQR